jgi:hypothetical protein
VKTLTADDYHRVRLPDVKARAKFAYQKNGNTITLTEVTVEAKEAFPPGSLKKFITPERNKELLQLVKGCTLEVPE